MKHNVWLALPCALSLSRAVVALLLLFDVPLSLGYCLAWAVLSDVLDGFLARRLKAESRLGTYLDPIADKLFALALAVHFYETSALSLFALFTLFSRDLSLLAFGLYLYGTHKETAWRVQSFFLGKVMTSLQFLAFLFLILQKPISSGFLCLLLAVGLASFAELYWRLNKR